MSSGGLSDCRRVGRSRHRAAAGTGVVGRFGAVWLNRKLAGCLKVAATGMDAPPMARLAEPLHSGRIGNGNGLLDRLPAGVRSDDRPLSLLVASAAIASFAALRSDSNTRCLSAHSSNRHRFGNLFLNKDGALFIQAILHQINAAYEGASMVAGTSERKSRHFRHS